MQLTLGLQRLQLDGDGAQQVVAPEEAAEKTIPIARAATAAASTSISWHLRLRALHMMLPSPCSDRNVKKQKKPMPTDALRDFFMIKKSLCVIAKQKSRVCYNKRNLGVCRTHPFE